MEDIQAQMGAILNDPDMMQKIAAMAQSMQMPSPPPQQEAPAADPGGFDLSGIDIGMIQKLSGLASQSGIDQNQKNLLNALAPYLRQERISKLEKAMRAAKMARFASGFLNAGGLQLLTGR